MMCVGPVKSSGMKQIEWGPIAKQETGVSVREFFVTVEGRRVPVVIWTPSGPPVQRALLLIGHGGSQHKTDSGVVNLARVFVLRHGFSVAAIDGPVHGARRSDGVVGLQTRLEYLAMWNKEPRIDEMVADWRAAIDVVTELLNVHSSAIGWFGVSMGTAYGLPLIAQDARIKVAVLGMWGTSFVNSERLTSDAPLVRCPILFQQKWNDELFTREGQIDLFDRLGSSQKWLKVYLGGHVAVDGEQLADAEDFLSKRLKSLATPSSAETERA